MALALCIPGAELQAQSAGYVDHDDLTAVLNQLTGSRGDLARMSSLGTTLEGREIWVVEVANEEGAPIDDRPALLVVANLEGDNLVGSAHAIATIEHLLTSYDSDEDVKNQLDDHVFYIVPRLNPDGAERMFSSVRSDWKRNSRPFDDDNDARTDEDGYEDLNGDGMITVMRVPDPAGRYKIDPEDPRFMREADPGKGEAGTHTLYWEGTDNDGDGFYNEDGPGGVDLNRNFQHEYPYWEADAGYNMVSERESRALMDFVVSHRNIAAILTYGESDNLVVAPNGQGRLGDAAMLDLPGFADASFQDIYEVGVLTAQQGFGFGGRGGGAGNGGGGGQRPAVTVNQADLEYFRAVSEQYQEISEISCVIRTRRPAGAFFEYGYFQFGVPSFSTPGWGGSEDCGDSDSGVANTLDEMGARSFVDWSAFDHPSLGDVEIGGFTPYATTNPPADQLAELGLKHARFASYLASLLPEVRIAAADVTAHGGGIFEVEVEVENRGYFPSSTQHGVFSRSVQAVTVQIQVDPEAIVTGDAKTSTINKLDGSGTRETFTWIIRGTAGQQVEVLTRAQKGGRDRATVTLR